MYYALQEYKCHNADILLKEDSTVDDLIDVIEVLRCMQACHDGIASLDIDTISANDAAGQPTICEMPLCV